MADKNNKPSKVETAKQGSKQLRGSVNDVLQSEQTPAFEHDDIQVLKFHGIYQQDDRDSRAGKDKHYMFMIRTKTPGGRLTAEQYLAMDDLAKNYTWNDSLRVTTRQAFQFHGVIKGELKKTMAEMNRALVSTLAACGDVERNVMCSPAPLDDPTHRKAQQLADEIARKLAPATGAYYEIWLDGEKVDAQKFDPDDATAHLNTGSNEEPFYGESYLPRKFKTGIALPQDNSIDVYTQDVGLVPVVDEQGDFSKVNVLVGGGLGMTHRKADTFARMGTPLGSVDVAHAADAVKVVASIFRDHGNRSDRRHARLKYLIEEWGIEKFREEFNSRAKFDLHDWQDVGPMQLVDYLGAWDQGNGKQFYGIWIQNGRIIDTPNVKTKSAIREIVEKLSPRVILTPNQSLLLADLEPNQIEQVEAILDANGVKKVSELRAVQRYSMACPALPTCGLALAESERFLPGAVEQIETHLAELGLDDEPMTIRSTGCPNGCARPYTADIAFVGRKPGVYDIFLGGRLAGDRMAELYADSVEEDKLLDELAPLFKRWAGERLPEETFGDFYNRVFANDQQRTMVTGSKDEPARERIAAMN